MIYYSPSKGGFYNSELHASMPDDIIEITAAQHEYFLRELNLNGKVLQVDENNSISVVDRVVTRTWRDIRSMRNVRLSKTDYTQVSDWPGDKEAWATYRQELRDITTTFSDPASVVWPTPPGE